MAEENKDDLVRDEDTLKTEAEYSEKEPAKTEPTEKEPEQEAAKSSEQEKAENDLKDAEDGGASPEEVDRIRKALAKANKESADRRHKLQQWDDLGVDPETIKQWKAERRDAEIKKAEEEGRYQDIIDRTRQESQEVAEKSQAEVAKMKAQLEDYLVDRNLTEAIASEEGIPKLLQSIARQYVKTVQDETTGEYQTKVVDESGLARVNEKGEEMSIRDLVASFKEDPDLQYAFKAPKTSGSGNDSQAAAAAPSSKPGPKPKRGNMTQKEQRAYVQKHGYPEFAKLPR